MSDPENAGAALQSSDDVDISLLTTDDWLELTTFFNTAVFDNPSTEKRMRVKLGLNAEDPFLEEFKDTVAIFETLANIGKEFNHDVVEEALSLADDIVQYNMTVQAVYPRLGTLIDYYDFGWDEEATTQQKLDQLVKDWKGGNVEGMPGKIKDRLKSMLEGLISDAEKRATRADGLYKTIMGDGTGPKEQDGLLKRLKSVKAAFDHRSSDFSNKFGAKSAVVVGLETDKARIENDLKDLRKKDTDETIVLSTSPLYLIIPVAGPFIMAGVLIGVGVDMANVRAKIDSLVERAKEVEAELDQGQRFMTSYDQGKDLCADMATKCEAIVPRLEKLGKGWRAVAKDLGFVVNKLSDEGRAHLNASDFNMFVATLDTAGEAWAEIAKKADHFRLVSEPKKVEDTGDLMKGAKAAA